MNKGTSIILAMIALVSVGCTGTRVAMNPGALKLVERIPDRRPDWADWGQSTKEEKDTLLFVGAVRDKTDYALAIREAGIEATKLVAEKLARELNTSLRSSVVGQNVGDDLGRTIQDIFVQESRNLTISGLGQKEKYVERWAEGTVGGQRTIYHAWVLEELSKADYLASKQALLDRAAGNARQSRNARAETLLNEFRAEIKKQ